MEEGSEKLELQGGRLLEVLQKNARKLYDMRNYSFHIPNVEISKF